MCPPPACRKVYQTDKTNRSLTVRILTVWIKIDVVRPQASALIFNATTPAGSLISVWSKRGLARWPTPSHYQRMGR
jgi:hypothetical protein